MSYTETYTCDWCGHEIARGQALVALLQEGYVTEPGMDGRYKRRNVSGWIAHFHGDRDCLHNAREVVFLALDAAPSLEKIPSISGQAVAARRRKHNREPSS